MRGLIARAVVAAGWMILIAGLPAMHAAPAMSSNDETVATVNGEAITVDDLYEQIGSMHMGMEAPAEKVRKPDPVGMLDRLIDAKMVVQEARSIGLDELPEFTRMIKNLRLNMLRTELAQRAVAGVTEGDPGVADRLFRDAVREFEVDSIYFASEDDAGRFIQQLGAGGDFAGLAEAAIAAGATGGEGARSLKGSELRPNVAGVLADMKPGEVSPPIRIGEGATVIKLLGVRYPENAEEREKARQSALLIKQQALLQETMGRWRNEYMEIDRELLDTLDFDSGPAELEKLRVDERVLARVKGGEPVTVRELFAGVEKKFFHGVAKASESNKIKPELPGVLDQILMERVAEVEAKRLKIEESASFRNSMRRGEERLLFEMFVNRVINPEVKLTEAELKEYYDEHTEDYLSNEMMRIEGVAFGTREDGQAALDKLRKGADFDWMRNNARGRADRRSFEEILEFDGKPLLTDSLPEGIRKAVAGVGKNEYRFFDDPEGPTYVLLVREVIPATAAPFDSVRTGIGTMLYARKRASIIEEWTSKLRAASDIEIFATGEQLKEQLGLGIAEGSAGEGS